MADENVPIWKQAAWVAAMATLFSAMVTIPKACSDYRVAKRQLEASRQEQQLDLVNNTLSQQGEERLFILRYLVATLGDGSSEKKWASEEIGRLEDIRRTSLDATEIENQLAKVEHEIQTASGDELEGLERKASDLRLELDKRRTQLEAQRADAGLPAQADITKFMSVVSVGLLNDYDHSGNDHHVSATVRGRTPANVLNDSWRTITSTYSCGRYDRPCVLLFHGLVDSLAVYSYGTYRVDDKEVSITVIRLSYPEKAYGLDTVCRSDGALNKYCYVDWDAILGSAMEYALIDGY